MSSATKNTDKIIAAAAITVGAFALLKTISDSSSSGEGSLGGTDDDPFMKPTDELRTPIPTESVTESSDTNTPDIVYDSKFSGAYTPDTYYDDTGFSSAYNISPDNITISDIPTSDSTITGITPSQYSLGIAGLIPTYGTKIGESIVKNTDNLVSNKIIKNTIEDTPFIGKKLAKFTFPDQIIKSGAEEIIEASAKTTLKSGVKKAGGTLLKSVPFIGTAAGAAFDISTNEEYKEEYDAGGWRKAIITSVAGTANFIGDVIGGGAAAVTSAAAFTGVGAVVPLGLSVAGQVVGESAVYGIYNKVTGKNKKEYQAPVEKLHQTVITQPTGGLSYTQATKKQPVVSNVYNVPNPYASTSTSTKPTNTISKGTILSSADGKTGQVSSAYQAGIFKTSNPYSNTGSSSSSSSRNKGTSISEINKSFGGR